MIEVFERPLTIASHLLLFNWISFGQHYEKLIQAELSHLNDRGYDKEDEQVTK